MEQSTIQMTVSLSKKKIAGLIIGSLTFILFGLWLILKPELSEFDKPYKPVNFLMGCLSILSGLFVTYYSLKKLRAKSPGLIINSNGLKKDFRETYSEWIPWADIRRIKLVTILWQKIIYLEVNNPQTYIKRQKNIFNKASMFFEYKLFDTPLRISSDGLNITSKELYKLIYKHFLLFKE
jgi:hypothetical protein